MFVVCGVVCVMFDVCGVLCVKCLMSVCDCGVWCRVSDEFDMCVFVVCGVLCMMCLIFLWCVVEYV